MNQNPDFIKLFESCAEVLDAQQSTLGLDDAIWKLAAWMGVTQSDFNENDLAVLAEIGGILYREGLDRKMKS